MNTATKHVTESIANSIQPFVTDRTIAGAVLLVGDITGIRQSAAIGHADIAAHRAMQPDALFWIASNTKQMTAAALMMLVDDALVHLDSPVSRYLPEFRGQMVVVEEDDEHRLLSKPLRAVTVRDLVSHTGGLLPWFHDGKLNIGSLRERALACALTPLRFEPGTKWEYGNGGFEVAGRIIEVVTGVALDAFFQHRLFDPLGMNDTTFWPTSHQLQRLATPYTPNDDGTELVEAALPFTAPLSELTGSPSPGGGLFSTATDCFRFCQMIAAGGVFNGQRLLTEVSVRAMTATQTGDLLSAPDNNNGYGLGWNTSSRISSKPWPQDSGTVHHGGAFGTNMRIELETGVIKVFMISQAGWRPDFDSGRPVNTFWDSATESPEAA